MKACYVGCYNDRPSTDLPTDLELDLTITLKREVNVTIEICINKCRSYGYYKYAALQNG